MRLTPLLAASAAIGLAHAQQLVVPENHVLFNTGTSSTPLRAGRQQYLYDTTHFTNAGVTGPITITRVRFRAEDTERNAGGQVWTMNLDMSSSPVDLATLPAAAATTFAPQRGADRTTVFSGQVTNQPSNGSAPNNWNVDIVLQTPFTYDPTLGLDLCLEYDSAGAAPATLPDFATSSVVATHRARRIAATSQSATSGTVSDFALLMLLDFTGPGGTSSVEAANVTAFGANCGAQASSCYQFFVTGEAFDLANTSLTFTPSGSNYVVTAGTVAPDLSVVSGTPDSTADEAVVVHVPGFTFPHAGGTTTTSRSARTGSSTSGRLPR